MQENLITIGRQIQNNTINRQDTFTPHHPFPNIDSNYGPYNSLQDALAKLKPAIRSIGLKFGVYVNGSIVEYWFESGIADNQAVPYLNSIYNYINVEINDTKDLIHQIEQQLNDYISQVNINIRNDVQQEFAQVNSSMDNVINTVNNYIKLVQDVNDDIHVHYFDLGLISDFFNFSGTISELIVPVGISETLYGNFDKEFTGSVSINKTGTVLYYDSHGNKTVVNVNTTPYVINASMVYIEFNPDINYIKSFDSSFDKSFS